MELKDGSLIDIINQSFIALTATGIHHCLSAWKQVSLGSRQSLVQVAEHNVSAIQETFIMRLIMCAQIYLVISPRIFVLPRQMFKSKR